MRELPFLNGVRAFEAAARLGSLAAAADELSVSAAAVSRMVKLLEGRLGVALFDRTPNRLVLTPSGKIYADGLTAILDDLADLTRTVRTRQRRRVLTIGVGPTFAIRWLIPRLGAFQAAYPDIEVRITTGGATVRFDDDWSCGIRMQRTREPGLDAVPLFSADLTPVCAPALAATLSAVEQLADATLIRVAHAETDWSLWAEAAAEHQTGDQGYGGFALRPDGSVFEFYGQALQAAADGLGVAMGVTPYINDDLAAGRLIAPFPVTAPKGQHWDLVFKPGRVGEPEFVAFRDWIIEEAGSGRRGTLRYSQSSATTNEPPHADQ